MRVSRYIRRGARALRAIHDEQVLMWEVSWQAGRVPVGRTGALAWISSLDGPRLTGSRLPADEAGTGARP
jgi:hypothetical protein